jgi:hypothetical protein
MNLLLGFHCPAPPLPHCCPVFSNGRVCTLHNTVNCFSSVIAVLWSVLYVATEWPILISLSTHNKHKLFRMYESREKCKLDYETKCWSLRHLQCFSLYKCRCEVVPVLRHHAMKKQWWGGGGSVKLLELYGQLHVSGVHWAGGWVGSRPSLHAVGGRKIPTSAGNVTPVVQLRTCHSIDWAISAGRDNVCAVRCICKLRTSISAYKIIPTTYYWTRRASKHRCLSVWLHCQATRHNAIVAIEQQFHS